SPAEACNIASALGLEVPAFDVHSACTSFLALLYVLAIARPEELPAFILVVAAESMPPTIDYSNCATAVLFGDAAAAAVVAERHHSNVEHFGNTAAAGAPSVMSMEWERWADGDDVALVGVGAGLTWAGAFVRFGACGDGR